MFGEIPAAIAAIRESLNLFNAVNDAKNQAVIDNAVYEINRKLHDIQMENTKLLEIINEKQKSIMLLRSLSVKQMQKMLTKRNGLESPLIMKRGALCLVRRSIVRIFPKIPLANIPTFVLTVMSLERRLHLALIRLKLSLVLALILLPLNAIHVVRYIYLRFLS